MNKEENIKRAKDIFAKHSAKDAVYFAGDGQAFFLESDRNNHSKALADKATQTVKREDVMPSNAGKNSPDDFEDDDDFTPKEKAQSVSEAKAAKNAGAKGKADEKANETPKAESKETADADEPGVTGPAA